MDELVLTLNIGTYSCEVIVFNELGEILIKRAKNLIMENPYPYFYEQDPKEWIRILKELTQEISRKIDLKNVRMICLTGHTQSLLLADSNLNPLTKCILWLDQRGFNEFYMLRRSLRARKLYELTGIKLDITVPLCKLLWVKRLKPKLFKKISRIYFSPKDYLIELFTGQYATDYPTASTTGFLNIYRKIWEREVLDIVKIDESVLPKLVNAHEVIGILSEEAAKILNVKAGTPVTIGAANVITYALGAGVTDEGQVADSTVVSEVVSVPIEEPLLDPLQRIDCVIHALPNKWLIVGAMMTSGAIIQWAIKNIIEDNSFNVELIDKYVEQCSPGARGLIVLPHFMGERTPYWNPKARGVILGLTLNHGKEHLVRALIESIGFGVKSIIEVFGELGLSINEIRIIGSWALSKTLRKVKADILGIKVVTPKYTEAACVGACILGLVGEGYYKHIEDAIKNIVKINEITYPDPGRKVFYEKMYEVYRKAYCNLIEIFEELSNITEEFLSLIHI